MRKNTGNKMSGDMAYILNLKDLSEANEDYSLVNEDTGYNPYDNPGTHKEVVVEEE